MITPFAIAADAPPPGPGLAARLAKRLRLWRERRRWMDEMADAATLSRLDDTLADIGVTRGELDLLTAAPVDSGRQFETFAEMAQVDLRRLDPAARREAMWVCARCDARAPCKRWLSTGVWRDGGEMRCPNAALLHH